MDKLYVEGARILRALDAKTDSFRSLVFQSSYKNKKQLYKICLETLKQKSTLREIVSKCPDLSKDPSFVDDPHLLILLLYEHFHGVVGLKRCRKRWRRSIESHATELLEIKKSIATANDQNPKEDCGGIPRYARVNTLKCALDDAVAIVQEDGGILIDLSNESAKKFRKRVQTLKSSEFSIDPVVPNLLIFAPGTDLHDYQMVVDGRLILQDKSSCLSAICLAPSPGDVVLDACAAPGMKTSHLAALMENKGRIFAVDKDERRSETMRSLLAKKGVTCAEIICHDFLALDLGEKRFKKITHILVDPPCSGSGIVNRGDVWTDIGADTNSRSIGDRRINSLGNLQAMMLKKALTLPDAKRVVYSTCSINERENETVVQEALEVASTNGFRLIHAISDWKHRGLTSYEFGHLCIRADSNRDATNGFFVATFER